MNGSLSYWFVFALCCCATLSSCFPGNFTFDPQTPETASPVPNSLSSQLPTTEVQGILDEVVEAEEMPGAVVYISTPEGTWTGASGFSDLQRKTPMKPEDRFALASTSKPFVAVVVLQLVEEGDLDLDEAIASYLPEELGDNIPDSDLITLRQLLNHTSGIVEYLDTDDFQQATAERSRDRPWTATEAIQYIYGLKPQAKPGKRFIYTNSNYILLEAIVETVTENSLDREIRDRILTPLNLNNTFTELREPIPGGYVTGYGDLNGDGRRDSYAKVNDGNGLGDGGLISSAEDVAYFAKALLVEKILLSSDMMQEMLSFLDDGEGGEYGLGIGREETDFGEAFGHSGLSFGFLSSMSYFPEKELIMVVWVNDEDSDLDELSDRILETIFDR